MTEHEYRTAAFAAIRRAAEVARRYEAKSDYYSRIRSKDAASESYLLACVIRDAIRAAIGSEKA